MMEWEISFVSVGVPQFLAPKLIGGEEMRERLKLLLNTFDVNMESPLDMNNILLLKHYYYFIVLKGFKLQLSIDILSPKI